MTDHKRRIYDILDKYIERCKNRIMGASGKELIFYSKCIENAEKLRIKLVAKDENNGCRIEYGP